MSKFYYNGVLLPEIPADVLAEYQYAWIRKNNISGNYDLMLSSKKWYFSSEGEIDINNSITNCGEWYTITIKGSENADEWVFKQEIGSGNFGLDSSRTVLWSNHDIPNGSETATTIYFYGTEPVPESGTEPDGPDSSEIKKYLIRSQNVLYTISDGTLTALESAELSVDVFGTHGFDELPDWSVISSLVNTEIMYCQSDIEAELPSITATMNATPFPQTVVSPNYDMSDDTILGVECAYVTASSDVVFAISVDDGVTWYMWTGQAWGTLTDTATGMTAETINAITTEQWAGLMTTGQFKVRMTLFDENSSFTSFVIDYIN